MNGIVRVVATAVLTAGPAVLGLSAATPAHAEPRYHWCPGEQWSAWMGVNWDITHCHDDHYIDLEPHDEAHWHGSGPFIPGWPRN